MASPGADVAQARSHCNAHDRKTPRFTRRQPRRAYSRRVIDNFSLGLTHLLLLIAAWRLLSRPDLDREDPPAPDAAPRAPGGKGWRRPRA